MVIENYNIKEEDNYNPYNGRGFAIVDISKDKKTETWKDVAIYSAVNVAFAAILAGILVYGAYRLSKLNIPSLNQNQKIERVQDSHVLNTHTLENKFEIK